MAEIRVLGPPPTSRLTDAGSAGEMRTPSAPRLRVGLFLSGFLVAGESVSIYTGG